MAQSTSKAAYFPKTEEFRGGGRGGIENWGIFARKLNMRSHQRNLSYREKAKLAPYQWRSLGTRLG